MEPPIPLRHRPAINWFLMIGCLFMLSIHSCRQDRTYSALAARIYQDDMLDSMNSMTHKPFAVINPNVLDSAIARNEHYQHQLNIFDTKEWSLPKKKERDSLVKILKEDITKWRLWQTDPALYNLSGEVKRLLSQDQVHLNQRLIDINQCLGQAETYYQAAKFNLRKPNPERSRLASQKQILGLRLLSEELPDSIQLSSLKREQYQQLLEKTRKAQLQIKDYIAFCESIWFEHLDSTLQKQPAIIRDF